MAWWKPEGQAIRESSPHNFNPKEKPPGISRGHNTEGIPMSNLIVEAPPQIVMNGDTARVRRTDPITSHEAADSNDTAASRTFVMFALIEHGMLAQFELERIADGLWSPSRIRTAVSELVERGLVEFAGIYRLTPARRRAQVWTVTGPQETEQSK